jgi:hypothetical protein
MYTCPDISGRMAKAELRKSGRRGGKRLAQEGRVRLRTRMRGLGLSRYQETFSQVPYTRLAQCLHANGFDGVGARLGVCGGGEIVGWLIWVSRMLGSYIFGPTWRLCSVFLICEHSSGRLVFASSFDEHHIPKAWRQTLEYWFAAR